MTTTAGVPGPMVEDTPTHPHPDRRPAPARSFPRGRGVCPGCGAFLSRYSDQARCAACVRSSVLPQGLWADPVIGEALVRWDFRTFFRLVRSATGMSQIELGALTGLSQSAISQIESGSRRLTHVVRIQEVLRALGVPEQVSPSRRPAPAPHPSGPVHPQRQSVDQAPGSSSSWRVCQR